EYHPRLWHPNKDSRLIHIDASPAEVDEHYILEAGVVGAIAPVLDAIAEIAKPCDSSPVRALREIVVEELSSFAENNAFPMKPQKIVWDLRKALAPEDIVISDVGAHKMWIARMYEAEAPNTCIISNGFASMGIALPGAVAAKRIHPKRKVVAVCGDAGFLMNSQEIETAQRQKTPFEVLIWNDSTYGLIEWHQNRKFGRSAGIDFNNPDFVKYAESFGAKGYRIEAAADLVPTLKRALQDDTVSIIDCPVDYSENMKLTEKLGHL
ncbi:MAG: acetolactate synthase large subunit, partial [Myxococcales bacterium]|nr:acetolactate synthase large subunit [Myxococcales bacterium]